MKNNTDIAIQLTNVSKKYEIHHEKPTLVEKFPIGVNRGSLWILNVGPFDSFLLRNPV